MNIKFFDELDSTNTYSKRNIEQIEDKTIICAHRQTSGRGRFDRKWVDLGDENLFLSIVLKPSKTLQKVYSNLTQFCALKLAKTFETYGIQPSIKWPNDILIHDKKISGILAETVIKEGELKGIIIGVGINLNANEKDFTKIEKKVTSLNLETKKNIDKREFLNKFLNKFFENYEEFLKNGFLEIKSDYISYANFLNKEITINNLSEKLTGIAEEITDDGALIINGKEFFTGDIL